MTNKKIARTFQHLADIMELHKDNPFKIRSYKNAYIALRKVQEPLVDMSPTELGKIKGVGKSLVKKIQELHTTGKLDTLEKFKEKTPVGVQNMLQIKGFGPKKILSLWKGLEVETVGELLYACNENRLVALKGFGQKTQADLKKKIEYYLQSRDKFHYATLEQEALDIQAEIQKKMPEASVHLVGAFRRKLPILEQLDLVIGAENTDISGLFEEENLRLTGSKENTYKVRTERNTPVMLYVCSPSEVGSKCFMRTGNRVFLEAFLNAAKAKNFKGLATEEEVFAKAAIPFIPAELREDERYVEGIPIPQLIENKDIKGVIHSHTTYSDGIHSLREMAEYTKAQGYEYIGITDHSQAAFYANGLKPDRVLAQMEEIDELNKELAPFKIFKGIESDILYDGSLDYEEEILQKFDFIIASVHTVLKMTEEKATARLITAIENPYTTILGHPTGRLLLSREGYPIDHKKVIDACAEHGVVIELNANPYRLDLDWTWIPYALEKGVKISVNPDAHSKEGIHDIHFGICAARKGGLTAKECMNALGAEAVQRFFKK